MNVSVKGIGPRSILAFLARIGVGVLAFSAMAAIIGALAGIVWLVATLVVWLVPAPLSHLDAALVTIGAIGVLQLSYLLGHEIIEHGWKILKW